jgi:TnpA family transposase
MGTASDLTAYPRLKTSYTADDLAPFTPQDHEIELAEQVARLVPQQLAFVVLLKSFQRLSYFPGIREVPHKVVEFIARSMGVPPLLPPDYEKSRTLYRHSQIIREHLGYQRYDKAARKLMRTAMYREAWIKDDIPDLINIALAELNSHHYELPVFDTINRLAQRIRTAVNRELGRRVMDGIGRVGQVLIDDLLQRGETGWWQRLKDPAPKATVRNLAEHLEYRAWLDAINVGLSVFQTMPIAKIQHFALMARQCDAARMREFIPSRRYAMAAALIHIRAAEAKDESTDMYIRQAKRVESDADAELKQLRADKRELEDALQLRYLEVLEALKGQGTPEEKLTRVLQAAAPTGLDATIAEVESLTAYAGNNYTSFIWDRYKTNRPAFHKLLREMRLTSVDGDKRLEGAIQYVLENHSKRAELIPPFPGAVEMLPANWRKTVVRRVDGNILLNRRHFEAFLFTHVVTELKAGNAVVPGSLRYADFRDQLVTPEEYAANIEQYGREAEISVDPAEFCRNLREWLRGVAKTTDDAFPENSDVYLNSAGEPVVRRIKARIPSENVAVLRKLIANRMTRVDLLDLLSQTHHWVPWTRPLLPTILGHQHKLERPIEVLIATVFANGCRLGPTHAAHAISELFSDDEVFTRKQVGHADKYHVTAQRLQEINAMIVNIFNEYPLPKYWGTGESASVDGTMRDAPENSLQSEYHHRYHQAGLIQYRMVSDKYIVLFSHFIPCSVWEAMELIRALMENQSNIQPRIIHGDTQAQTATAFGLCKLWGIDLMPRIRNWKGLKLLRPDADSRYQHIDKLFADQPVNWDLIETHLPDMLRVVLSIRMGRLSPDLLKRILTTYGAKNHLNQALSELGRAVRNGYLLTWLSSRELRQEVHSETNKSETTHAFYDFLAFGGEKIKQADREEQDKADKYEELVGNLVTLYNTVQMTAILDEMAQEGIPYSDDDLTFLSPLITEHINRFGKYRVDLAKQPKVMDLNALHTGFLRHHQPPTEEQPN